jgi:hypothetical protein
MPDNQPVTWLCILDDEDLMFLKRFVLASGSLKELAGEYGVSYPTVRLRLDRLIAKVKVADAQDGLDSFERTLKAAFASGRLDQETYRKLMDSYDKTKGGTG